MSDALDTRSRAPEHAVRPAPVDREPGTRLEQTLLLVSEIDRAARRLRPMLRAVEGLTGLSPAQVHALLALAEDGGVADRTRDDGTIGPALAGTGLVIADGAPSADDPGGTGWRLSDSGRAALEQVQGLQIRILDTAMAALPEGEVDEIVTSLRRISASLEGMHPHLVPRPGTSAGAA